MAKAVRTWIFVAFVWLGVSVLIGIIIWRDGFGRDVSRLYEIASDPVPTEGTIVSTDCFQHNSVYYEYKVGDQTYYGGPSRSGNCSTAEKGDNIKVAYARHAPSLSFAGDPRAALADKLVFFMIFVLLSPLYGAFLIRRKARRASKQ